MPQNHEISKLFMIFQVISELKILDTLSNYGCCYLSNLGEDLETEFLLYIRIFIHQPMSMSVLNFNFFILK